MKKIISVISLGLLVMVIASACSESQSPDPADSVDLADNSPTQAAPQPDSGAEMPLGRLDQPVEPTHYRLELRLDPRQEQFSGSVSIDLELGEAIDLIWLHGNRLEVSEAWVADASGNRVEATYEQVHTSGVSRVDLDQAVGPGEYSLNLVWEATFNPRPNALFRVERNGEAYAATQFQPIAAREAFPGFDEPGFKVPFDITMVTRTGDVTITNTPERSAEELDDGFTRHVFETTRPLPTYLLAFAVGPYDLVEFGDIPPNEVRQRPLPLRAIAAKGQGEKLTYALENTAGILGALETYFGTEYPYKKLDLIAMPTSFGGAMENAGAITYDEFLILMDESSALDQRRAYTSVHAHELGHMWFGDLVTPDWWTDIWLNESFATWIAGKAADEHWEAGEFDRSILRGALGAMNEDSLAAARQIREPVSHNDAIADAFDGITYQKGGGVLAMIERYSGEESFRDGIRLHMDRHADGVANAEDFIASVAEGTGQPEIREAFNSFIEQPGVPLLDVAVDCEGESGPTLNVTQSRYAPLGSSIDPDSGQWLVPVCVSYRDGEASGSQCVMLRERSQNVPLESDQCPSNLHPNADGAGYYRFNMEESWWQGLVAGIGDMPASEALSAAESLDAAFRAGKVSAETYLAGISEFIKQETWDVSEKGLDQLEAIVEIIPPEQQPIAFEAFSRMARARYDRVLEESGENADLLKTRILRFMLIVARDPELRAPQAELAARRIGMNGEPDPGSVPQSELQSVLSIGVQDLGAPFFDRLMEVALSSDDSVFAGDAFGALARTEDPELVARLQQAILDSKMPGYEPLYALNRQMARSATTELTYQWLRENFEAIVELIPEMFRGQFLGGLGSSFCTVERAQEWQAFIESYSGVLSGYERSLAQAMETAMLCAALREEKAAELLAALEKI